jgi:hypothetical protein
MFNLLAYNVINTMMKTRIKKMILRGRKMYPQPRFGATSGWTISTSTGAGALISELWRRPEVRPWRLEEVCPRGLVRSDPVEDSDCWPRLWGKGVCEYVAGEEGDVWLEKGELLVATEAFSWAGEICDGGGTKLAGWELLEDWTKGLFTVFPWRGLAGSRLLFPFEAGNIEPGDRELEPDGKELEPCDREFPEDSDGIEEAVEDEPPLVAKGDVATPKPGLPKRLAIEIPAVGLAAGIGEPPLEIDGVDASDELLRLTPSPDWDSVAPVRFVGSVIRFDIIKKYDFLTGGIFI